MLKAMMSSRPARLGLLLWLLVPLLLWWVLSAVPLPRLWDILSRLGWLQIGALLALNVLVLLTFSGRWWVILRGMGYPVSYLALSGYRLAAFAVSYFTPGPHFGGEPLQAYLVSRRQHLPGPAAAVSVGMDKLLEVGVNFTFLLLGVILTLHWQVLGSAVGREAVFLALALLALPLGLLLATWAGWHPLGWILGRLPCAVHGADLFQRIRGIITDSERLATDYCRQHPASVAAALLVSLISWATMLIEYWLVLYFIGIQLTPVQLIGVVTAARVAMLLPMPGALGTLEASQVLIFQVLGLDPAAGLSVSLIIRARDILFGAVGLWWGGCALGGRRDVRRIG